MTPQARELETIMNELGKWAIPVRVIMKVVRNTVEDVKFIIATMVCSVLVAWH